MAAKEQLHRYRNSEREDGRDWLYDCEVISESTNGSTLAQRPQGGVVMTTIQAHPHDSRSYRQSSWHRSYKSARRVAEHAAALAEIQDDGCWQPQPTIWGDWEIIVPGELVIRLRPQEDPARPGVLDIPGRLQI